MELIINETMVIDKTMWDLIDQLWAYIADMFGSLKESAEAIEPWFLRRAGTAIRGVGYLLER